MCRRNQGLNWRSKIPTCPAKVSISQPYVSRLRNSLNSYQAELDGWLYIGVVSDVGNDLSRVRRPGLLKGFHRIEVEVAQGKDRWSSARRGSGQAFFDRHILESRAKKLANHRNMFFAVVG